MMSGETISVVCPYCGLRQPVGWKIGDSGPKLRSCGYQSITNKPFEGCFKHFVIKVEWITRITEMAIVGEGDD